ncbi:MAG: 3-hydroxyacyl-CoA dehydrogenase NAD-binding domain-containing protein [Proteobacteria bacterium]|nr:3-hydroxyacyl-CoA dehydrogenase NAD-binding domain-containing protein [Pseudomonadota bacterium]
MENIAIIGTGLIGRGWAMVFARAGHRVALYDADPKALKTNLAVIRGALKDARAAGIVKEAPERIFRRIRAATSLEDALAGADYAQENISETLAAKKKIFAAMDKAAGPKTILASSTSTIPASAFTMSLAGRGRCLVAHPVNPPHLVPLVELCPAPWTSKQVLARARALHESVGQVPITVKKEIQGFILNRLQAAVLNAAFSLYAEGYASASDIDKTEQARTQPARPWKKAVVARIARERRAQLPADKLAARQAWRDRRLMALVAHKRDAAKKIRP